MLLRNDQYMGWSLWINIVEGVGMFVFVNFLGGYFPANDAAEQTIVHDTVHASGFETRHAKRAAVWTGKARAYYIRSEKKFAVQPLVPTDCWRGKAYGFIVRTTRNSAFPLIIR